MAPQSAVSPKMTTPALPMTPLFYCRILLHYKNVDVCKKLEVNPLRFDWDIRDLSQKKIFLKFFILFDLQTKNAVNHRVFKIFPKFFFYTKNVDVCKKLEVNPLRFDRDIRVLSSIKTILKIFHFFALWTKSAVNQQVLRDFSIFFSTWSIITTLFYMLFNQHWY